MVKREKIGNFAQVITGGTPSTGEDSYWNGDIPWINSGELNQEIVKKASCYITKEGLNNSSTKIMPIDTVLIALTGATTGKTALLKIQACANQSVTGILPSSYHIPKYLYYYLGSIREKVIEKSYGGAQKHISQGFVKNIEVPLPSLEDQKRIVKILDTADALRQKRKHAITLLEDYIKSVFLDMFGDPVLNPKGWEKKTAIDYSECIVPGRDKPKSFTGGIPWVTTDDLIHLGFTEGSNKNFGLSVSEIKQVRARIIPKNSVLITCVGDLGISSITTTDMVINQQLHAFQCHIEINPIFFMHAISYQVKFMLSRATITTVPYMNKTVCNCIPMLCPPIDLQNKFAIIVKKTETLKQSMLIQSAELETQFQSLLQKSFRLE